MATFFTNNPLRNAGFFTTHDPTTALSEFFGILKRYTGTVWTKAKLLVYTGTFVANPTKRWDGSAWKEIDVTGI